MNAGFLDFSLRYQEFDSLLQKINNRIVLLAHTDAYNFSQTHHLSHLLTDRVEAPHIIKMFDDT